MTKEVLKPGNRCVVTRPEVDSLRGWVRSVTFHQNESVWYRVAYWDAKDALTHIDIEERFVSSPSHHPEKMSIGFNHAD